MRIVIGEDQALPHWAFAIDHDDFTGSATRRAFAGATP